MCLDFDFFDAAKDIMVPEHPKCDNITHAIIHHPNGRHVFSKMPIVATGASLAMWPCRHTHLLVSSVPIKGCMASDLAHFTDPAKFVRVSVVDLSLPTYRGLGNDGGGDDGDDDIAPAKCVVNVDGTSTFILETAKIQKIVRDGNFGILHNRQVARLCLIQLRKGLAHEGYPDRRIWSMVDENNRPMTESSTADDATVRAEWSAIDSKKNLTRQQEADFEKKLLPNLIAGVDMLVAIPAFSASSRKSLEGVFNFTFQELGNGKDSYGTIPLLGLTHNVEMEDEAVSTVPDDFYVVSNYPYKIDVASANSKSSSDDASVQIELKSADKHLPDLNDKFYTDVGESIKNDPTYEADFGTWVWKCKRLQERAQDNIWATLKDSLRYKPERNRDESSPFRLPPWAYGGDGATNMPLYIVNLKDEKVPVGAIDGQAYDYSGGLISFPNDGWPYVAQVYKDRPSRNDPKEAEERLKRDNYALAQENSALMKEVEMLRGKRRTRDSDDDGSEGYKSNKSPRNDSASAPPVRLVQIPMYRSLSPGAGTRAGLSTKFATAVVIKRLSDAKTSLDQKHGMATLSVVDQAFGDEKN